MKIRYVCVKSLGKWKKELAIVNSMLKLKNLHQILPDLTLEELFKVLDNIVEVPQFNLGQTTIRRDASNWNPYDSGTFVSNASK